MFFFVVLVLIVQTFKEYTPFAAVEGILGEKPPDYFSWGNTHLANKEYDKAIADYTEAIKLDPKDAGPHEWLAWVLATVPKNEIRNGKKAVEHATKACELIDRNNADYLATLSAAYAESGDFKEAINWQKKALEFPELDKQKADEYRQRLAMYEQAKPYRERP
jgi:tetratricopeptide (TPR) repeat protein